MWLHSKADLFGLWLCTRIPAFLPCLKTLLEGAFLSVLSQSALDIFKRLKILKHHLVSLCPEKSRFYFLTWLQIDFTHIFFSPPPQKKTLPLNLSHNMCIITPCNIRLTLPAASLAPPPQKKHCRSIYRTPYVFLHHATFVWTASVTQVIAICLAMCITG